MRRSVPKSARASAKRGGAALVEMAFVVIVFLMILFGIIEYCRLCFVRQVVVNAVREGARYAVVNTTASTIVSSTQDYVKSKMFNLDAKALYYNCQVYLADSSGNNIGAASSAQFGQLIAVQVDYDFEPLLPNLLRMNNTLRISSKALMISEAN